MKTTLTKTTKTALRRVKHLLILAGLTCIVLGFLIGLAVDLIAR